MMEELTPLLTSCTNELSAKALLNGDVNIVQKLIDFNLFTYNNTRINNVEIFKLLSTKGIIDVSKIEFNQQSLEIIKFLMEDDRTKKPVTNALIRNTISNNNIDDAIEKIRYFLTKVDNINVFGKGANSLIYYYVHDNSLKIVDLLLNYYDSNEKLKEDLTTRPYIKSMEMARLLAEDFGYPGEWISTSNTSSSEIDHYLASNPKRKLKTYVAVEFNKKQDNIKFPNCLEFKRDDKWYYGYLITDGQTPEQVNSYVAIVSSLGEAKFRQL